MPSAARSAAAMGVVVAMLAGPAAVAQPSAAKPAPTSSPAAASQAAASPAAGPLASAPVTSLSAARQSAYDGVVEAVRQTVVAAQVSGAVVALAVKAGDRVTAGQVLLRLDARAAEQQASAAAAQVQAARAAQDAATRELERQRQLFQKNYISQAALDRAEAQHKSAQAQAAAQLAAAGAARTESLYYTVRAPYAGIVSEVSVVLGDMAMPGRPLLTVYDPAALRVTASVPQGAAPRPDAAPRVELPGQGAARIEPVRWQLLPAVDPATHTMQLRMDLPAGTQAAPGLFARAWLSPSGGTGGEVGGSAAGEAPRLSVPARAVVRRAELTAVYVIGEGGRPLLRLVRLGPAVGDQVEVLSGLTAGERVALDPQAAARVR